MIYCEYCGQGMDENDAYCKNCGAPAPVHFSAPEVQETTEDTSANVTSASTGDGDYSVAIESIGSCSVTNATDILREALGYTIIEAQQLLGAVPTDCASNLSKEQATYIAQALTEYGMSVTILKNGTVVNLNEEAEESVFDGAGSFIKKAILALGTLTAVNRKKAFKTYSEAYRDDRVFRPGYYSGRPPQMPRPSTSHGLFGSSGNTHHGTRPGSFSGRPGMGSGHSGRPGDGRSGQSGFPGENHPGNKRPGSGLFGEGPGHRR